MKNAKRMPLTTEDAQRLTRNKDWKLFEIPRQDWDLIPGLQRREDTFACMGSASPNDFRLLNMIQRCVAGFDQLVHETNPKPGEPPGNTYHYVVPESGRQDYPYILHGPFCTETRIPLILNRPISMLTTTTTTPANSAMHASAKSAPRDRGR